MFNPDTSSDMADPLFHLFQDCLSYIKDHHLLHHASLSPTHFKQALFESSTTIQMTCAGLLQTLHFSSWLVMYNIFFKLTFLAFMLQNSFTNCLMFCLSINELKEEWQSWCNSWEGRGFLYWIKNKPTVVTAKTVSLL